MKFIHFIILVSIIFLLKACCKNEFVSEFADQLPPYTQEGKNIIACKINNRVWANGGKECPHLYGGRSNYENPTVSLRLTDSVTQIKGHFYLYAYRMTDSTKSYGENMTFGLSDFKGTSSYYIDYDGTISTSYPYYIPVSIANYKLIPKSFYKNRLHYQGMIDILYWDRKNRIIAGRFEFNMFEKNGKDTVKIREGRFDVKY